MVFDKFHNMKQEKKNFLMSPLNSNKLTNFHFTTSQNNITITVHKCSIFFFFFFHLCTAYFFFKSSFFSFFFFSICCVQQCSSFFFFPLSFSIVLYHFFFFFFYNKLLIHYPFFSNLISASLCLYLNTLTIGLLRHLFNFNPCFQ